MAELLVQWTKLDPRAIPPLQAYPGDAGWDLHILDDTRLAVGEYKLLGSGLAIAVPPGFYARVVGRSSAMLRRGLLVIEGVCDSGYRGEQMTGVVNLGRFGPVDLKAGDSIAQIVVSPIPRVVWAEAESLDDSERGLRGYGSSGR